MATYQIYELSARAVMSYAVEQDGVYTFALNRSATEHCRVPGAKHEQDSCAMFHQLMYQLHGEGWRERSDEKVTALSDVLFYMDFAGIFDRRGTGKMQNMPSPAGNFTSIVRQFTVPGRNAKPYPLVYIDCYLRLLPHRGNTYTLSCATGVVNRRNERISHF